MQLVCGTLFLLYSNRTEIATKPFDFLLLEVWKVQIVKERIEGDANEKAVLELSRSCLLVFHRLTLTAIQDGRERPL